MNTTEAAALGEAIRKLRRHQGLTAEKLAYQAGVSKQTVLTVENGKFKERPYSLPAIAEVLHVPPDDIINAAARLERGRTAPDPNVQALTQYDQARDRVRSAAGVSQPEKQRLLAVIDQFEVQQRALDDSLATILDGIS